MLGPCLERNFNFSPIFVFYRSKLILWLQNFGGQMKIRDHFCTLKFQNFEFGKIWHKSCKFFAKIAEFQLVSYNMDASGAKYWYFVKIMLFRYFSGLFNRAKIISFVKFTKTAWFWQNANILPLIHLCYVKLVDIVQFLQRIWSFYVKFWNFKVQ